MLAFFEKTYDTRCGDWEHGSSEKKVTIENLEFHVQGQIELTRTPANILWRKRAQIVATGVCTIECLPGIPASCRPSSTAVWPMCESVLPGFHER